jgi:hypothetical protein
MKMGSYSRPPRALPKSAGNHRKARSRVITGY